MAMLAKMLNPVGKPTEALKLRRRRPIMTELHTTPPQAPYWPNQPWRTSTPEEQGMDSAMLAGALEFARATDLPLHSVTVIRDGLLVLDAFLGFVRDTCRK
jgi:hypothetical protein